MVRKAMFSVLMGASLLSTIPVVNNSGRLNITRLNNNVGISNEILRSSNVSVGDIFEYDNVDYMVMSLGAEYLAEPCGQLFWEEEVTIHSTVEYKGISFKVKNISEGTFIFRGNEKNMKVKKLTICEGIETCGDFTFDGWTSLEEINLPSTLQNFSKAEFPALRTITLPDSNSYFKLDNGVLYTKDGKKLLIYPAYKSGEHYDILEGTEVISQFALSCNMYLKTLNIPNTVKTIENRAIRGMESLESLTIPESVTNLQDNNISVCNSLKELTLKNPGTLKYYSVYQCNSLEKVIIDGNLDSFGYMALSWNRSLKEFEVINSDYFQTNDDGVLFTKVGNDGKYDLVRFPASYEGTEYCLPENVGSVWSYAFGFCTNVDKFILNKGVKLKEDSFCAPNIPEDYPKTEGITPKPTSIWFTDDDDKGFYYRSCAEQGAIGLLNEGSSIYFPSQKDLDNFNIKAIGFEDRDKVGLRIGVVKTKSLSLGMSSVKLKYIGDSKSLEATRYPYNASEPVTYRSSNTKVVTVSERGVIKAVGVGEAIITVESGDCTKQCSVSVGIYPRSVDIIDGEGHSLYSYDMELDNTMKNTMKLKVVYEPEDVTVKVAEWSSSDESVVKVDQDGNVSAVGVGSAVVSVKAEGRYSYDGIYVSDEYITAIVEIEVTKHECDWRFLGKLKNETCTEEGILGYICDGCGKTKTEKIAKLGHVHSKECIENRVYPTVDKEGSYEKVVYCKRAGCGAEISREKVIIPKLEPDIETGWVLKDGKWYYVNSDGSYKKGWFKDGKWYYLDENGVMLTGWQCVDKKWYYFDGSGRMQTGWKYIGKKWYYLDGSGAMRTGWQKLSGVWYYFDGSGAMKTDWQQIGGKWYYFDGSGAMKTDWQYIGKKWYYFDGSGVMKTDWQQIGSEWYYFNSSGAMKTGWFKQGIKWYYFDGSGAMKTDWQQIGGKWYYFDDNGVWVK